MTESYIESWLVKQVKKIGGLAEKFVSPGNPGVPDRIVILPGGRVIFVEMKTEKGRLAKIQEWQKQRYESVGAEHRVLKGMRETRDFVEEITKWTQLNAQIRPSMNT